MPATHDLAEIWIALRTALLADATLVGLLSGPTAIDREFPGTKLATPHLVMRVIAINAQVGGSFTGRWRPLLDISAYVTNPYTADAIFGHLEQAWSIPLTHAAPVESTNLRLSYLRKFDVLDGGIIRVADTNEPIRVFAGQFNSTVALK